jgi:hypothetical protein
LNRFRYILKRFNETIQKGATMVDLAVASNFARELTEEQFDVRTERRPGHVTEERLVRPRGVVGRVFARFGRVRR